jgi:pimeloyl-ACP methyl ester carboxylesterase
MQGQIVTVTTDDSYILHGMVCVPSSTKPSDLWIIHVHGSYGNFYENFFLSPIADSYTKAGISFISINTRGRDYYADFKTKGIDKYSSKRIGGIREIFAECVHDIRAWIKYARQQGASRIVLQGHSLGAMKVAFHAWKEPENVDALILLSPPDNIGLQKSDAKDKYDEYLDMAKKLILENPEELMPAGVYYDPITCASYCGLFANPENTGMFTYGDTKLMRRSALGHIDCPILTTFATQGEAVVHDLNICKKSLETAVKNPDLLDIEVIEGANHSYHFREEILASTLSRWINLKLNTNNSNMD